MSDLIDRQAAIDKFEPWLKVKGYSEGELNMLKAVLYELRFLPSAQPEPITINFAREADAEMVEKMRKTLKDAPILLMAFEPERKKGKWIEHPNQEFKEWDVCTACGIGCKRREYEDGGMTEYNYPYCPNCGADMRGEEDE